MQAETEPTAFTYEELAPRDIRILKPADSDDGRSWRIETVSLDAPDVEFDALSYTWGPKNETYPILCNGRSMLVHRNLFTVLPFLARRGGSGYLRPIWVDAVCINQADDKEKYFQIRLMHELYRRSKQVWIWLGCAAPNAQAYIPQAITLLPHIVEEARRRKELSRGWRIHEVAPPLRGLHPDCWTALLYLLRNSWYRRVWIVQEAALATNMIFLCGAHSIDSALLQAAVEHDDFYDWKAFDTNGEPIKFTTSGIDNSTVFWIRELVQGHARTLGLDTPGLLLRMTLLMTGEHSCYLPQDRVFGMLGLVPEKDLTITGVSFQSYDSIPTLYTQFSKYILLNTDPNETQFWWNFFNLSFTFRKVEGLPSWVPDFHHQDKNSSYICTRPTIKSFGDKKTRYQASDTPTVVESGLQTNELVIRGKIIDEIILTHPSPPSAGDPSIDPSASDDDRNMLWLVKLTDWEQNLFSAVVENAMHRNGEEDYRIPTETYWRTLVANNIYDTEDGSKMSEATWLRFRENMQTAKALVQRALAGYVSNLLLPP